MSKKQYVTYGEGCCCGGATHAITGCRFSLRPIFTMLVNAIRWSESVAMAMESKGFYGDGPRTYYTVPKVHGYDWLYGTAWVAAVGIATAICM